jgi:hypothetical protein
MWLAFDAWPKEDPHLRSIKEVAGYQIHVADGVLGPVEHFVLDEAGWTIRYVAVDTRTGGPEKKFQSRRVGRERSVDRTG